MAIQQHPLPQDITSYRFRLIGDMTIKQFAYLAGFAIAGLIFYNLPLPFFFRYPLAFLFVLLGIGIAFVPIQGRSMETWIIAFIRSIYSPTQYVWRQGASVTATSKTTTPPSQATTPSPTVPPTAAVVTPQTSSTSTVVSIVSSPVTPPTLSTTPTITPTAIIQSVPVNPETKTATPPSQTTIPTPVVTPTKPIISATPQATAPTTNLPIPFTPTTPNTLVGLTLTSDSKILDNVLVEIQSQGVTLRATKSNRLGQFMFARPLENGLYQILAEKDGSQFSTYSLNLKGDIVKPLKIQAEV